MARDAVKSQYQQKKHNTCSHEHQPAILFQDGLRLVPGWHKRNIAVNSWRSSAGSGLLRNLLQSLCTPESVLISWFHCTPPWLLAINGTGNKMGRSTCSAC